MFGLHHIRLSTTAALMAVAFLCAIAFKIADRSTTYEAPRAEMTASNDLPDVFADREPGDWRQELIELGIIATGTPETATSSDPVAYVGDILATELLRGYETMKATDSYTIEGARSFGTSLGTNVLPIPTSTHITTGALTLDSDTSAERVLRYRADMREATSPLITDAPPELVLFAEYLDSQNSEKLRAIESAAARYRTASQNLRGVSVPSDAADHHVRAVNALEDYADTLDRLVLFSAQPLASLALLRTYNEAERELLFAFDVLAQYYVRKTAQ